MKSISRSDCRLIAFSFRDRSRWILRLSWRQFGKSHLIQFIRLISHLCRICDIYLSASHDDLDFVATHLLVVINFWQVYTAAVSYRHIKITMLSCRLECAKLENTLLLYTDIISWFFLSYQFHSFYGYSVYLPFHCSFGICTWVQYTFNVAAQYTSPYKGG